MLRYAHYSQNDPKWKSKKLGTTTLGRDGCLITTLTNGLANLGVEITPPELVDALTAKDGLEPCGELRWEALERVFPNIVVLRDQKTTAHPGSNQVEEQVKTSLHRLQNVVSCGQLAILNVDAVGHDDWPDHFVLLTEDWNIIDPWDGQEVPMTRYGTPDKAIKRYVVVAGDSPLEVPDGVDSDVAAATGQMVAIMRGADPKKMSKNALNILL